MSHFDIQKVIHFYPRKDSGPEPEYDNITKGYKLYTHEQPFSLKLNGGILPQLDIAYETWGKLNEDASNAVVVLAGLSASSHARSSVVSFGSVWLYLVCLLVLMSEIEW